MKQIKVLFSLLMAVAMIGAFAGCGSRGADQTSSEKENTGSVVENIESSVEETETVSEDTSMEGAEPAVVNSEAGQSGSDAGYQLPYALEDSTITVNSLFPSSVENVDSHNEITYIENLATIELANTSGQHIDHADVSVTLDTGAVLSFYIEDIPPEKKVWAFEQNDQTVGRQVAVTDIQCTAEYYPEDEALNSAISFQVDHTNVTITNNSTEGIQNLSIEFHCLFDESIIYGGKTCTYNVAELGAGGTTTIDVIECLIGSALPVHTFN